MNRYVISFAFALVAICISFASHSQGIDGYSTVFLNGSNNGTYTWYAPEDQGTWVFNRNSGAIDYIVNETSVYITIKFKAAGTLPISYWGSTTFNATIVIYAEIPQPPAPVASTNSCGQAVLNYPGTPPTDVEWHWQTSPGGQNQELGSQKTVTSPGPYYLRAKSNATSEWGPTSPAWNSFKVIPGTPATNTIVTCPGVVSLTTTVGTNGSSLKWYTTQSGGSELGSSTPTVYGNTVFWASSISSFGCESPGRAAVSIVVNNPPAPASLNIAAIHACAGQAIHIIATGAGEPHYRIKLDSTTLEEWASFGTDFYYQAPAAGALSIWTKSYDVTNGCGFGGTSTRYVVDIMAAPTQPNVISVTPSPLCPNFEVTLTATPVNGDRVNWYSSESGGSPLPNIQGNANTIRISPQTISTQFWVTSARSGVCESPRYPVPVNVTPDPPDDQNITASSDKICVNQAVQLTATGPGHGDPYFFYSTDNGVNWNPVPNSTGQSSLSFTPTIAGDYKFRVSNKSYCGFCWETGGCAEQNTTNVLVQNSIGNPGSLMVNNGSANSCYSKDVPIVASGLIGTPVYWIVADIDTPTPDTLVQVGEYGTNFTYPANKVGNWSVTMRTFNSCGLSELYQSFSFTVWAKPGVPSLPNPAGVCRGDSVNLSANPGTDGEAVKWYTDDLEVLNPFPFTQPINTGPLVGHTRFWAVSYAHSCESDTVPLIVRAHDRPNAILDPAGISILCNGCTKVLTTQHIPDQHYVWFKDGINLQAADQSTYEAFTPGIYSVRVTIEACVGEGPVVDIRMNTPPAVNAGQDRNTLSNLDVVEFVGSAYDAEGPIATYLWTQVSGDPILMQNTATNKLTVSGIGTGPYTFRLTVTDDLGASNFDDVVLNVTDLPENRAYIIEEIAQTKEIFNDTDLNNADAYGKLKSTTYFDAIGRPAQKVQWRQSQSFTDIVQPATYDIYGRVTRIYLPYTSGNNGKFKTDFRPVESVAYTSAQFSPQYRFYQETDRVTPDSSPYSKTEFEPSPLNRVITQGAPGNAWQPENNHAMTKAYRHNNDKEVMHLSYDNSTGGVSIAHGCAGYYGMNMLSASASTDEEGNQVIEFTDKFGRIVCKKVQTDSGYASTYYVYDNVGNMVVVISPQGAEILLSSVQQYCP